MIQTIQLNENSVEIIIVRDIKELEVFDFKTDLLEVINNPNIKNMIINCINITYLDSYMLSMLVYLKKRCGQKGGVLTFVNICPSLNELFHLTYLDLTFNIECNVFQKNE